MSQESIKEMAEIRQMQHINTEGIKDLKEAVVATNKSIARFVDENRREDKELHTAIQEALAISKTCEIRHTQMIERMENKRREIDKLALSVDTKFNRLWWIGGVLYGTIASAVGYLLTHPIMQG